MRSLAETHLGDYDMNDAVDALYDIDNCTAADLPDRLLVEAARRYLKTISDSEGGDSSEALRQTLFEFDL
jgi:hypothetical protein